MIISWELNPVSTIPFVGKYWNYWYVLGNGRPSCSEEIVSTIRNNGEYVGEMSEDETEILVNPEMRIIKQVTVADVEKANQLFDDLMGNAVEPRKEFIKNHSQEAVQYGI